MTSPLYEIDIRKAEDAFHRGCPCCHADLREFDDAQDDEDDPSQMRWMFRCGCDLRWESGEIQVGTACPYSMDDLLKDDCEFITGEEI